jgi:hypothetical protein
MFSFKNYIKEEPENRAMTNDPAHFAVHGMSKDHLDYIASHPDVLAARGPVTFQLPDHLDPVPMALAGPAAGGPPVGEHEVHYANRGGGRAWDSRMIHGEHQNTQTVTAISVPHKETGKPFLITAFGGPLAPKEPGDPTHTPESKKASEQFWSQHALLTGKKEEKTKNESVDYENLHEIVRKKGKNWVVLSHSGKNLGKFDSKSKANARLKQVEMFKHMKKSK